MKTIKEWLMELEEPYKSMALKEHYKYLENNEFWDEEVLSGQKKEKMSHALADAFRWSQTEDSDGGALWADLFFKYKSNGL